MKLYPYASVLLVTFLSIFSANGFADHDGPDAPTRKQVTLISIGDIHGHLIPRANLRSDGTGRMEGGLARMYSLIDDLRDQYSNSMLFNIGDTTQGSAEALYTRGSALIDVLNAFGIDYFAPGNWDFVYGTQRFHEMFVGAQALAPWNALAANLTYSGAPYADKVGQRVLPPYAIRTIAGVKFGILGFTTERGPKVIGAEVVQGFAFTQGDAELAQLIPVLRQQEKVDVIVMLSELGLANNIRLANGNPGVDVILSADMHEETPEPVVGRHGTLIVEMGQDGTRVGRLTLTFDDNNNIVDTSWRLHVVDDSLKEDRYIASLVRTARRPFVQDGFEPHINPINQTVLNMPIDTVIGTAKVGLHRSNFAGEQSPAVLEGSSHNFLTDVFRDMMQADLGVIRGFRYGTHIPPGPIKLEDIYHYIPIGPFIAKGEAPGSRILKVLENSADGSLNPVVNQWKGGWFFGWSGLRFRVNPYAAAGARVNNPEIFNRMDQVWEPLDPSRTYSVAGYNYMSEPSLINKMPAANVMVYKNANGDPIDATQVVAEYLKTHDANPDMNRITPMEPLPLPLYGNPEMQPLGGAPGAPAAVPPSPPVVPPLP